MTRRAGFLAGLFAAVLAALPPALRFEPAMVWQAFAVCTAGCALVMAPLSAALASARSPSRFRSALTVGVLLAAAPLLPFATILKTSTHHRPLGGVTFAVLASLVIVGLSMVCGRLVTWAGDQRTRSFSARVAVIALAALGTAALLLGLMQALKGGDAYRTGLFDALRVLGLATLAARVRLPDALLKRLRGIGLAAWIAVVTVGLCLGRAPAMQAESAIRCPVIYWPLLLLGG